MPVPDFAKMTDKELGNYVMEQRIQYQGMKGILTAIATDLRVKTVFRLPGDVKDFKGLKKDGPRAVSRELKGNELLNAIRKGMAQDDEALKKIARQSKSAVLLDALATEFHRDAMVTVPKLAEAQFDYTAEVKAARAAYPALRMQFKIEKDVKLPGE